MPTTAKAINNCIVFKLFFFAACVALRNKNNVVPFVHKPTWSRLVTLNQIILHDSNQMLQAKTKPLKWPRVLKSILNYLSNACYSHDSLQKCLLQLHKCSDMFMRNIMFYKGNWCCTYNCESIKHTIFVLGFTKVYRRISGLVPTRVGLDLVPGVRPHVPGTRLQRPRRGGQKVCRRIWRNARDILSGKTG